MFLPTPAQLLPVTHVTIIQLTPIPTFTNYEFTNLMYNNYIYRYYF